VTFKVIQFFQVVDLNTSGYPPTCDTKIMMNCVFFFGQIFLPGGILVLVPGTVSSSIFQTFGSKAHAAANYHRHPGHPQKAAGRC